MANAFVHLELSTGDVPAARAFYQKLFAWKFQQLGPEMGNYVMIDVGQKDSGGGIAAKNTPGEPTAWLPYVQVDNVKMTIAKAQAAGARIVMPFMDIGGMGAIGIFVDPTGASLGVYERNKAAKRKAKPAAKKVAKKTAAKKKAGKKR